MKNILVNHFPDSLVIGSRSYPIRTDFRTWILVSDILSNLPNREEYRQADELWTVIDLVFIDRIQVMSDSVIEAVLDFYRCGKKAPEKSEPRSKKEFDFDFDSDSIYASFLSEYGIRLKDEEHMHWYEFMALFSNLGRDTAFVRTLEIRRMKYSDVPKNKQKELAEAKAALEIPLSEPEQKAQKNLAEALKARANGK